jgi:hypothetical protein
MYPSAPVLSFKPLHAPKHATVPSLDRPDVHTRSDKFIDTYTQLCFVLTVLTWLQMPMAVERTDVGNSSAV